MSTSRNKNVNFCQTSAKGARGGAWGAVSGTGGNVTYIWLWNGMLSLHGIRLKQMRTQQSQALHRTPAKANKKKISNNKSRPSLHISCKGNIFSNMKGKWRKEELISQICTQIHRPMTSQNKQIKCNVPVHLRR